MSPALDLHDVLVVIPCLNEEAHLSALLARLDREAPSATIVVADGGSSDASRARSTAPSATPQRSAMRGCTNSVAKLTAASDATTSPPAIPAHRRPSPCNSSSDFNTIQQAPSRA